MTRVGFEDGKLEDGKTVCDEDLVLSFEFLSCKAD